MLTSQGGSQKTEPLLVLTKVSTIEITIDYLIKAKKRTAYGADWMNFLFFLVFWVSCRDDICIVQKVLINKDNV